MVYSEFMIKENETPKKNKKKRKKERMRGANIFIRVFEK